MGIVSSYLVTIYITTYLAVNLHYSMAHALLFNNISSAWLLFWMPLGGWLSDKRGRKNLMLYSIILMFALAIPYYHILQLNHYWLSVCAQLLSTIPLGFYNAIAVTVIVELIPTHVRFSACNIGYNLGAAAFGGTTPLLASYLLHKTHDLMIPAYYLMLVCVITFYIIAKFVPETFRISIKQQPTT